MSKSNSVVHALALASLGVATGFLAPGLPVMAADGGAGVYLLGKRGPLAAFVPKPGWYLTDDFISTTRAAAISCRWAIAWCRRPTWRR